MYERGSRDRAERRFRQSLDEFTAEQIETLGQLQKPELTLGSKTELGEYFEAIEPVSLGVQTDGEPIGRREFFDTFRLERGTLFYRMLERTYELIEYRLKHGGSDDFLRDAYEFWNEYYAADPSWYDLPSEWREIAGSASNKQKVMFAVETVQSILGRLMLAKACEDYDFPNIDVSEFVEQQTRDYRGNVSHVAYVEVTSQLMDQLRQELVESVFEQDLYYWWNTLAEDTRTLSDAELHDHDWPTPVERFGAGFAEFIVAIARFDFSTIQGDPLGDLYQQYFDPGTRRALGEFYTPPGIVEHILDSVEYEHGIQHKRLVDPACGSGTFLVEALRRYKTTVGPDPDWADELRGLCERSRIVGIDIHPFAVVLAQIRFMLEILPEYRQAIEDDPGFVLKRLPIYRTDSLIDETELEVGVQQSLFATCREEFIEFEMTLPIRDSEEFESMRFELQKRVHSVPNGS